MIVDIPKVLREKLGDDGCSALVEVMNHVTEKSKGDVIELCTQRFERRLAEEHLKTRTAIDQVRVDLMERIAGVDVRVANAEVRLLRWLVTLIIIQGVFSVVVKHLL